jgi:hypothetical protein
MKITIDCLMQSVKIDMNGNSTLEVEFVNSQNKSLAGWDEHLGNVKVRIV